MVFKRNDSVNRRLQSSEPALSPRFARLVRESWWFLVVAAFLYLALILATYSKSDPGWSFSGTGAALVNRGGVVGAWLSDLLLYLFGLSAWWWVMGGVVLVVAGILVSPGVWRDWYLSLTVTGPATGSNQVPIPLPVRLLVALLLVTWGARTDRRWTVVVATTLALPTLWFHGLAMLVGGLLVDKAARLAASIERFTRRLGASARDLQPDRAEA